MLNRRGLILTGAATAVLVPLAARAEGSEDARLDVLLDTLVQEDLHRRPEGATQLGLDTGANADLRGKLTDGSAAGLAAAKAQNADQLRRLAAIDRGALTASGRVNLDTLLYTRRSEEHTSELQSQSNLV